MHHRGREYTAKKNKFWFIDKASFDNSRPATLMCGQLHQGAYQCDVRMIHRYADINNWALTSDSSLLKETIPSIYHPFHHKYFPLCLLMASATRSYFNQWEVMQEVFQKCDVNELKLNDRSTLFHVKECKAYTYFCRCLGIVKYDYEYTFNRPHFELTDWNGLPETSRKEKERMVHRAQESC